MAAHYIGIMAQKLRLFDEDLTEEQAKALAWEGLYVKNKPKESTIAYQYLTEAERAAISLEMSVIRSIFPTTCN